MKVRTGTNTLYFILMTRVLLQVFYFTLSLRLYFTVLLIPSCTLASLVIPSRTLASLLIPSRTLASLLIPSCTLASLLIPSRTWVGPVLCVGAVANFLPRRTETTHGQIGQYLSHVNKPYLKGGKFYYKLGYSVFLQRKCLLNVPFPSPPNFLVNANLPETHVVSVSLHVFQRPVAKGQQVFFTLPNWTKTGRSLKKTQYVFSDPMDYTRGRTIISIRRR